MIESVEVIVRQPGHPDRSVTLEQGANRVGRSDELEIVLADVGVSRRHAQIFVSRDEVLLEDLGSGNGTYFNGQRIQSQALANGDEIVIDPFVLQMKITGAVAAPPQSSVKAPAVLEVIVGTDVGGHSYPLTKKKGTTLGRSEERDVVVPDPAASRHHATVLHTAAGWLLRDEGSANGIFLNEKRIREQSLSDGDVIRIGNTEMRFKLAAAAGGEPGSSAPGDVWNPEAGRSQAPDLAQVSAPPPAPKTNIFLALAVGGVVVLLALIALILLVLFGGLLMITNGGSSLGVSDAPRWDITVQSPLPESADARFELGVSRLGAHEPGSALEAFHATLVAQPGHRAAERFARAASELVIMQELTHAFSEAEHTWSSELATRDALLATMTRGGDRSGDAREALAVRFAHDPVVTTALDLPATREQRAREAAIEKARATRAPQDAFDAWTAILADLRRLDDDLHTESVTARRQAGRTLARITSENWRAALMSEDDGDAVAALDAFDALESDWPATPARLLHPR